MLFSRKKCLCDSLFFSVSEKLLYDLFSAFFRSEDAGIDRETVLNILTHQLRLFLRLALVAVTPLDISLLTDIQRTVHFHDG